MNIFNILDLITGLVIILIVFIRYKYPNETKEIIAANDKWLIVLPIAWALMIPFFIFVPSTYQDHSIKALKAIAFTMAIYWLVKNGLKIMALLRKKPPLKENEL